MFRMPCQPRKGWQQLANEFGFHFHTMYGEPYWDESAYYQYVNNSSGSFFMPFMAGYMVSSLLSPNRYYSQPLYTSYSYNSPFRSRWITADGYVFDGDIRKRKYRVNKDVYKPKPTVNRTMKRGGFGSSVRAKSSWGSSSRKGGWGG